MAIKKIIKKDIKKKIKFVKIKKLSNLKFFLVLSILMLIDVTSSFIAVTNLNVYEMNPVANKLFSLGILGLILMLFFGLMIILFCLSIICGFELIFRKNKMTPSFRIKMFYLILGAYLYVFVMNFRVLINLFRG